MADQGRVRVIRATAAAGCLALLVVGAVVILLPAVVVGLLAGGTGIRRAGDDLEAAGVRLGVALLVSLLLVVLTLMSGNGVLVLPALMAVVAFGLAWRTCDRLRRERRLAWGRRERELLERDAALHRRRDELRNGVTRGPTASR